MSASPRVQPNRLMNIDLHPVFGNKHIVRHRFYIGITMESDSVMSPAAADYCNRIISRPLFSRLFFSTHRRGDCIFMIPISPWLIVRREGSNYTKRDCFLLFIRFLFVLVISTAGLASRLLRLLRLKLSSGQIDFSKFSCGDSRTVSIEGLSDL